MIVLGFFGQQRIQLEYNSDGAAYTREASGAPPADQW